MLSLAQLSYGLFIAHCHRLIIFLVFYMTFRTVKYWKRVPLKKYLFTSRFVIQYVSYCNLYGPLYRSVPGAPTWLNPALAVLKLGNFPLTLLNNISEFSLQNILELSLCGFWLFSLNTFCSEYVFISVKKKVFVITLNSPSFRFCLPHLENSPTFRKL